MNGRREMLETRVAEDRARGASYAAIAERWGLTMEQVHECLERGLPELRELVGTSLARFLRRVLFEYVVLARDAQLEHERAETSAERQSALRLRQSALTDAADLAVRSGLLPRVEVWGVPEAAEKALVARARLEDQLAAIVRDAETPEHIREDVRRALAAYDSDTGELLASLREVSGVS